MSKWIYEGQQQEVHIGLNSLVRKVICGLGQGDYKDKTKQENNHDDLCHYYANKICNFSIFKKKL